MYETDVDPVVGVLGLALKLCFRCHFRHIYDIRGGVRGAGAQQRSYNHSSQYYSIMHHFSAIVFHRKISKLFTSVTFCTILLFTTLTPTMGSLTMTADRIKANAERDGIDLSVLPFLKEALDDLSALSATRANSKLPSFTNATRIDTHTHPVPTWFRALQPLAAGRETPSWDPISHLEFMSQHSIAHSVLCVSTPQANAFPDDRPKTVALARLLNEYVAQLALLYPERFSWLAVTPLPYMPETLTEVRYAREELGAAGIGVLTNHEGLYPGEEQFDALWKYLQERAEKSETGKEVVFIHPHDPVIRLEDGRLVSSKPCKAFL